MIKKKVIFTVPQERILEPILYTINHQYDIKTDMYMSDITDKGGSMKLELEGDENQIEKGLAWVESRGINVEWVK
jgi:L-aspartate semialdehyde sulfurtransferase ferredoxin